MTVPFPSAFMQAAETIDRMGDKAALAKAQDSVGSMTVDPDKVGEVAGFFRAKAQQLLDRTFELNELAKVKPAGLDQVSKDSANVYEQVADGDAASYLENYRQLAIVLEDAADALEGNVRQWRIDDQDGADSIGGGKA